MQMPMPMPVQMPAPVPAPVPAQSGQTLLAPTPDDVPDEGLEEQMCDVLSPAEFGQELTELLLNNIPTLTGQQVVAVRQNILELAGKHGWVDI